MYGDQPKAGKRGKAVERLEKRRSEDGIQKSVGNLNETGGVKKGRRRKNRRKRKGGHKGRLRNSTLA